MLDVDITTPWIPWVLCVDSIRYATPDYNLSDVICPPEEDSLILPATWSIYGIDDSTTIPETMPIMKYIEPNLMIRVPAGGGDPDARLTGMEEVPSYYAGRLRVVKMDAKEITKEDLEFMVDSHNSQLPPEEYLPNSFAPVFSLTDWVSCDSSEEYDHVIPPEEGKSCALHWTTPPPEDMEESPDWDAWLETATKHTESSEGGDNVGAWEEDDPICPCFPECPEEE